MPEGVHTVPINGGAKILPFPTLVDEQGKELERWITRKTPSGTYVWFGLDKVYGYPHPDRLNMIDMKTRQKVVETSKGERIPVGEVAQIVYVGDHESDFDRDCAIDEIHALTGYEYEVLEQFRLPTAGFFDSRCYLSVVLRRKR